MIHCSYKKGISCKIFLKKFIRNLLTNPKMQKNIFLVSIIISSSLILTGCNSEESNPQKKAPVIKENPTIVYATVKSETGEMHEEVIDTSFHSIKLNDTTVSNLFTLTPNQSSFDTNSEFKFCADSQKIYLQTSRLIKDRPYQDAYIQEVDLSGKIKDLTFTGTSTSPYKNWEPYTKGFALSPDCKKIAWSNTYYQITDHQETDAANEIITSSIDGTNKKILLDIHKDKMNNSKTLESWPKENAGIVYLSNYNWDRNGKGGGLLSLDTKTGKSSAITEILNNQSIWTISDDVSLIAHSLNFRFGKAQATIITNLKTGNTYNIPDNGNGKKIFSPDTKKLASTINECSGLGAELKCVPSLYVFDYTNAEQVNLTSAKIATNFELIDWISNDTILGKRDDSLITINLKDNSETTLVTTEDTLLFIGIME